jgi:hypothetical protein
MSIFNFGKKKTPSFLYNEPQLLYAKLLFESEPQWDDVLLEEEIAKNFPLFTSHDIAKHENKNTRQYFFRNYVGRYAEGELPAQGTIFKPEKAFDQQVLTEALRQVWHWNEAKDVVANCRHELMVSDLLTMVLTYKERVECYQKYLSSVVKVLKPKVLFFPTSEKLIHPDHFLEQLQEKSHLSLYGLINVRLFNIQGGGLFMDTVGLHALGLPDFQIRFQNYDPGQIAALLYSYAQYIFDRGSVIENGNTVDGIEEGSFWKCVYSHASLPPKRLLIEIQPV